MSSFCLRRIESRFRFQRISRIDCEFTSSLDKFHTGILVDLPLEQTNNGGLIMLPFCHLNSYWMATLMSAREM